MSEPNLSEANRGLLSMRYLTYLSATELNFIFKNYLAVIPLQILAFLYIAFYWRSRSLKAYSSGKGQEY